jgi:hypothetical protein
MQTESLLPCSQESATGLYPEPNESSPQLSTIFHGRFTLLSSHLRLCLSICLFPSVFLTKILYAYVISPMRATCMANFILLGFISLMMKQI